jgi:hypothetical protein
MNEESKLSIAEAHLHFARQINGRVWALMDKDKRTQAENDEMLYAAHACTYHWLHAGTAVHQQRGEWLISHVHGALDNAREALRHAERCLALTEACKGEMQDFDIAYAYEGLARAHAQAGNQEQARQWHERAQRAGAAIADEEDRAIFTADFEGGRWHGLK